MKKQKLEDVFEVLENQEIQNHDLTELTDSVYKLEDLSLTDADIVRIEENVPFYWSGVTGCNTNERAQNEYRLVLTNWVKDKMYEYRNWQWIR